MGCANAVEHSGRVYDQAPAFLAELRDYLECNRRERERERTRRIAFRTHFPTPAEAQPLQLSDFQSRYTEMHRADFAYALWALDHGLSELQVRDVIDQHTQARSAQGGVRRRSEYLERTITNAKRQLSL